MQFYYKDKGLEKEGYLKRLVVNTKRGKPHLTKGDVFFLRHTRDEFHLVFRLPFSGLDTINVSRSARAFKEGPLTGTHWLDAPLRPARKKIKASKAMTN